MDLAQLATETTKLGVELSADQIAAFQAFGEALYERNKVMNLTRIPKEECWSKHFLDSLLICPLLGEAWSIVDVGTGPGFPAWPLACARPDLRVTALDGSNKGLAFLKEHPLPNFEVVQCRAEEWDRREVFDASTGRALAPLAIQLEVCAPWVKVGGLVLPFRTPGDQVSAESFPAEVLGLGYEDGVYAQLPEGAGERFFPFYLKFEKTPKRYPRKWSEIRAKPLG
ncbi:MAG: 16S rRNA (guanine(527)-N(7))-methyltransferase RsmG [Armatimonadetes bacterium]|nr:16S rRNA (guanine(527)-N(7))-methyltransferase RsmG [Armatimonadota bacterium]